MDVADQRGQHEAAPSMHRASASNTSFTRWRTSAVHYQGMRREDACGRDNVRRERIRTGTTVRCAEHASFFRAPGVNTEAGAYSAHVHVAICSATVFRKIQDIPGNPKPAGTELRSGYSCTGRERKLLFSYSSRGGTVIGHRALIRHCYSWVSLGSPYYSNYPCFLTVQLLFSHSHVS